MKKYYVYVISSQEGFRYTGMTEDIENRIIEHNQKTKSFWTKRGNNWQLVYIKEFESKIEALKYERWMKSGHGKKLLKDLGL
jgi:putative endonuclease